MRLYISAYSWTTRFSRFCPRAKARGCCPLSRPLFRFHLGQTKRGRTKGRVTLPRRDGAQEKLSRDVLECASHACAFIVRSYAVDIGKHGFPMKGWSMAPALQRASNQIGAPWVKRIFTMLGLGIIRCVCPAPRIRPYLIDRTACLIISKLTRRGQGQRLVSRAG